MRPDQVRFTVATEPVDPDIDLDADPPAARGRGTPRRSHHAVLAVIAAGGAIGTGARYGAALLWPTGAGSFPWTTLGVNVAGCLLIGVLLVALTEAWTAPAWMRPFLATGVLGGFTTFSTYCLDIERLVSGGRIGLALGYLAATVVAALAAVTAGTWTTRGFLARTRRTARRARTGRRAR
ncbi:MULTISPECIES: fluoride efflux transporter FluC [unclassified Streptosporangium]|uniref:fluoride efflux transporter FluC n=1 Tax=unclassified Streptosporangium TaxID=2632669 RepID=UPI002E293AC2|nr:MULTISPECIES: CrcB family protein [unclassified Streptosporangium]